MNDNIILHKCGEYNFYSLITENGKYIVGGVPAKYGKAYYDEAKNAKAIILLTSKPEFTGGVDMVLEHNPHIDVYATSSGLRNIKELVNRKISEKLIKDGLNVDGIEFIITPNIHWVDTAMAVYCGGLFSGEMFSQQPDMDSFYRKRLLINRSFVAGALEKVKKKDIKRICPGIGDCILNPAEAFDVYEKLTSTEKTEEMQIAVVYHSESGFTKALANCAYNEADKFGKAVLIDAGSCDCNEAAKIINSSDILIIGTNTVNRNIPQPVWDIITRIDLINKRRMPYLVFGSFGWAGDGMKLLDKTLSAMGFSRGGKNVEVLFKPTDDDFCLLAKSVEKLIKYYNSL